MAETKYAKPLPRIDEESKGFWEACQRHELYIQRCGECGALRYYPRALCPSCLSERGRVAALPAARGTVYTFTVTYQNQAPGFRDALPYVLAYVELDEGVRLLTNIVGCAPDDGAHRHAGRGRRSRTSTAAVTLPKFKPAAVSGDGAVRPHHPAR